jgi:hypothetical protein
MKRLGWLTLSLFLLCAIPSTGQKKTITVYTDNFSGLSESLGVGKYNSVYLGQSGISMVRSIAVPAGMKVILYSKDHFEGNDLVIFDDATTQYLQSKGFAQMAQRVSLIVAEASKEELTARGPMVTIYQDNFAGVSKNLPVGYYEFADFGLIANDQISSIKIPKGLKVTLYANSGFSGKSLVLSEDAVLKTREFNDITSSLRVEEVEIAPVVVTPSAPPVVKKEVVVPEVKVEKPAPVDPNHPVVTFFQDNFSGSFKQLVPGRYDVTTLGVANNELSSVWVPEGLRLTLYENEGFKGRSLVIAEENASTDYLSAYSFDNVASSWIIEKIPQVTLYQDNFAGNSFSVRVGRCNLGDFKIENDELSSVKLMPGMWVLLFENDSYQGKSLLITQDASTEFLQTHGFDNMTSSLVVGDSRSPLPVATLYQDDFTGRSKKLTPGEYDSPLVEIGNNALSSIEIPRGLRVTLFENDHFDGRKMILYKSEGTDFFNQHSFNDLTSSIIVEMVDPRNLVVTLYVDSFKGFAQDLPPGKYRGQDLYVSTDISSVRVPSGMRATLYEHDDFTGRSVTIDRDTDYTGFRMFDNFYHSVVVEDAFLPDVTPLPVSVPVVEVPVTTPPPVTEVVKVVAPVVDCGLSDKEYYLALKAIEAKAFSAEKMSVALLVTKEKCLNNEQIRGFAGSFDFEDQSLEFVKYAYELASEKSTYYTLDDIFKFMSSKDAFLQFLKSK